MITRLDVKDFIEKTFTNDDNIVESDNLIDDLAFDSLAIVHMEIELEKEYNIEIDDEELEKWVIIRDVINPVMLKL